MKAGLPKHPRDVFRREAVLRASGLAAAHAVIGEVLYVRPPAFGLCDAGSGESENQSDGEQRYTD
jgi:hypothetical protein